MLESIISEIDAEIVRLTAARDLLGGEGSVTAAKPRPGRPAKATSAKPPKRRTMSAEAKEHIRQAQVKRWAAVKKPSATNLNATIAPIPRARKKAVKSKA